MPVVTETEVAARRGKRSARGLLVIGAMLVVGVVAVIGLTATTGLQFGPTYILLYTEGQGPSVRGLVEPLVLDEPPRRKPEVMPGPWGRSYRLEGAAHARGFAWRGRGFVAVAWFRGRRL